MKKAIPLLILALLLCSCAKEEPENPCRLKTQEYINYNDSDISKTSFTYFYDDQGRRSRSESDNGDVSRFFYDEYGNHIRTETQGPSGTDVVSELILTLDETHRPVRSEHYWNGEHQSTTVYTYDRYGNASQLDIEFIHPDGSSQSCVTRDYDRDGNLLREETTGSNGSSYSEYRYQNGHLSYYAEYDTENERKSYSEYVWEEATRTETRYLYRYDGVANGKVITVYDEYGNPLKVETFHGPYSPLGGGDDQADRVIIYTYERIPE